MGPSSTIPVELNKLRQHVRFLSSLTPPRNYLNLGSINKAAEYIYKELESYGYHPEWQPYNVNRKEYKNILASYGPADAPRIVVGAHYDVCGDTPGADDNASAVAGLLELARLVKALTPDLKKRIDFAAYTLEEPPFFATEGMGSAKHAQSLLDAKVDVYFMICLEMIGYFTDEPNSQEFPLPGMGMEFPKQGNFITLIATPRNKKRVTDMEGWFKSGTHLPVVKLLAPSQVMGVDFSDHRNFWNRGYQAVMVTDTAFYRSPHYHAQSDTMDTLDFARMAEVVKGLYLAIINL